MRSLWEFMRDKKLTEDIRCSLPLALALVGYPSDIWTKEDIETATTNAAERILDFIYGVPAKEKEA